MSTQYRIIERGTGHWREAGRGVVRLDGADALTFLHGLLTNDVAGLAPGEGRYAAYLTPQGRMLADLDVYRRPDAILCSLAAGRGPWLAGQLDRLIFAEDVRVQDVSADWVEILVAGATASDVLARACGAAADQLDALADLAQVDVATGFIARTTDLGVPAFRTFVRAAEADAVEQALAAAGSAAIAGDVIDALRIANGRPAWGSDLNEDVIPLEAGLLDRAISTSKGCYVGQEIVIRMLHRGGGRVAKRLMKFALAPAQGSAEADDGAGPDAAAALVASDGSSAGRLTSVARSPVSDGWIALGYLHRDHAVVGNQFTTAEDRFTATATAEAG